MENQTGKDRNRPDQGGQDVGRREGNVGREGNVDREGSIGQHEGNPAGTSGRDADLQREGNLGNERSRKTPDDQDQPESGTGNRPGQNR
jgi:hypothetical protein